MPAFPVSGGSPLRFELLRLGTAEVGDPAVTGGKAATLSFLSQALPGTVPRGWALPAEQAAAFFAADDPEGEQQALDSLRAAIGHALGGRASASYAVRSSGLDEDSPEHSFAGQYQTFLAVSGEDSLAHAVGACVRSSSAPQIAAYRRRAGNLDRRAPAVLLQEMVPAERAGVAFTSNPVSGADEVVVDAGYGLGDLVVGGEITPDEFGLDRHGEVLWKKIGSKRRMTVLTAHGVTRLSIPRAFRRRPSLSSLQLSAVAAMATLCGDKLGYQADVEWALVDGKVFVLQARPMTVRTEERSTP